MSRLRQARIIPCLLLNNNGLVKTTKFKKPVYLGDPRNVVKIFNDKEADELVLLDISATAQGRGPRIDLIQEIASECFMPLAYGGGIRSVEDVKKVISCGLEKVVINSSAITKPAFIEKVASEVGSQSVVVSIDVRQRGFFNKYEVHTHCGKKRTKLDPVTVARQMEAAGAGEILLNSIDRDGTMSGYDLSLINQVVNAVGIPVVACGGASNVNDLAKAVKIGGASAASAGSMFVFQGKLKAVLISFPTPHELETEFSNVSDMEN